MLLNVGLRTDIVTHYSKWLIQRFREGFVYSRNPLFPHRIASYELSPERIDAVLFCSKNYMPILADLHEISDRYRTLFHYTVNGYGRDIEPNTPALPDTLAALKSLSALVGREKVFWRYDPILLNAAYTAAWHAETFANLAEKIAPYVRGCIVNFAEASMPLRERIRDFIPTDKTQEVAILAALGAVGQKYGLPIRICGRGKRPTAAGIERKACVLLDDIAAANGCQFQNIAHRGNKRDCSCIESRDVGTYDSCSSMCRYCNANRNESLVKENAARHDPASPLLIGSVGDDDVFIPANQDSYLVQSGKQLSLFDVS